MYNYKDTINVMYAPGSKQTMRYEQQRERASDVGLQYILKGFR